MRTGGNTWAYSSPRRTGPRGVWREGVGRPVRRPDQREATPAGGDSQPGGQRIPFAFPVSPLGCWVQARTHGPAVGSGRPRPVGSDGRVGKVVCLTSF